MSHSASRQNEHLTLSLSSLRQKIKIGLYFANFCLNALTATVGLELGTWPFYYQTVNQDCKNVLTKEKLRSKIKKKIDIGRNNLFLQTFSLETILPEKFLSIKIFFPLVFYTLLAQHPRKCCSVPIMPERDFCHSSLVPLTILETQI